LFKYGDLTISRKVLQKTIYNFINLKIIKAREIKIEKRIPGTEKDG
jgi:hypothetical protein